MARITPKTDWLETDRCTYEDMNRIAGNVNEICGASLKANYTQNDVVTLSEIRTIITTLETKKEAAGYDPEDTLVETATADGLNAIESYTLGLKDWIDLLARQASAKGRSGDDIFAGDGHFMR